MVEARSLEVSMRPEFIQALEKCLIVPSKCPIACLIVYP